MHDPGKQLRHYVAKQYVEVAGTNSGWQNKSNSVKGNRRRTPANKEPFLNQLTRVILVHNWYRSTSTCFHVYSREYTCSVCCHEFDTCRTGSELVRFHWYVSSREFT